MPTRESTKAYYEKYHASPKAKKERAMRNAARAEFEKKGLVHKGDGKDIDHKKPLSRGGSNADSNLRVQSVAKNRGYRRDAKNRPI
jgi:hypothetical protein